ncbi:MAG: protein kinase [Thermoguttaceae bacterium]|jgi:serine/threonine protein kinase
MRYGNWETIESLGKGGQGEVFVARDRRIFDLNANSDSIDDIRKYREIGNAIGVLASGSWQVAGKAIGTLLKQIEDWARAGLPSNLAAVKVLHKPQDARDPERAGERIKREMEAMLRLKHPNLVCVREADPKGQWFASDYYPGGALSKRPEMFKGDLPRALRAFRGLVDGVAKIHAEKMIHRDIKPQNILISASGELVLGDFGLVFFNDEHHTRLSGTIENVGTRDWMPAWATGMKIEDVKPTFDVFSLGKVLWAMLSGKPFLRLWYWEDPEFNLEQLFPQCPYIGLANQLLAKSVVQHERDCLPNASRLLSEVDKMLLIIQREGEILGDGIKRHCRVCGVGDYVLAPEDLYANSFQRPAHNGVLKVFTCNHCGHVQMFLFPNETLLPAWHEAQ